MQISSLGHKKASYAKGSWLDFALPCSKWRKSQEASSIAATGQLGALERCLPGVYDIIPTVADL